MERECERERSPEETDQLSRSTKKMKRVGESSSGDGVLDDMETAREEFSHSGTGRIVSYRDTLQRNNPNLTFETRDNPIWMIEDHDDISDDDVPADDDDPLCPTILLTAAEKKLLREPWKNALIIRMFDKGIRYLQLKRRLKAKWALKGDFSLIDIGCEYYVTRFTNMEDYDHVMTNGPWMIGDNYLVIREWVPNFVPEEDHITKLTAWVRIPKLSVEYFNKSFLLHKIRQKIGRVLKIDSTTENVERGQYTRMCVEVDLTKPLLSKFRLNGRVWGIQYEGLKMICFKCGKQGHKEDMCGIDNPPSREENLNVSSNRQPPEGSANIHANTYGNWMLVKKTTRRTNGRSQIQGTRNRGREPGDVNQDRSREESNRHPRFQESVPSMATAPQQNNSNQDQNLGSRFRALATFDLNTHMETTEAEDGVNKEAVSNDVTNSELVMQRHMETEDLEGNQNGSCNLQRWDLVPQGRNPEPMEEAHATGARERRELVFGKEPRGSAHPSDRGPLTNQTNRESRLSQHSGHFNSPGPARILGAAHSTPAALGNPPGRRKQSPGGLGTEATFVNRQSQLGLEIREPMNQNVLDHGGMELDN